MNAHLGGINMRKTNQKGFTIIELLVVIVIIGILVALALPQLFAAQARGRDTDRKNDLKNISQQLETYYNDEGEYPDALADLVDDYLAEVPTGPKAGETYDYTPVDEDGVNVSYTLSATLENDKDTAATNGVYTIESVNKSSN